MTVPLRKRNGWKDVLLNKGNRQLWYSKVGNDSTWIWANFPGCDPNRELVEINVRRTVFYPEKPFVNYITVEVFTSVKLLRHGHRPLLNK